VGRAGTAEACPLRRPSFRVTDENAAGVLTICQRLDGLPLATELAAARMRIMSAAQLAERLDDIFAVLVGGGPDPGPPVLRARSGLGAGATGRSEEIDWSL